MGREKKYTPRTLEREVNTYFRKIRRTVKVFDYVPTGEHTKRGTPIMKAIEAKDDDGNTMKTVEYVTPPSLSALCLHLGISRTTWAKYARDESMAYIVEAARLETETYWTGQLSGKNAQGAKFALQNACGWRGTWSEKLEVDLTDPATKSQKVAKSMTLEEKQQLLMQAGLAMAEDFAAQNEEPETDPEEGEEA